MPGARPEGLLRFGRVNVGECIVANPPYGKTNTADLAGMRMPNAPKYKLNQEGEYDIPTSQAFDAFVLRCAPACVAAAATW